MKAYNILELIGNTPHLKLNNMFAGKAEVWMKIEKNNPGGSIKDRIALGMIEDAEKKGQLQEGSVIIEPSSGNTGIAVALVAAVKKYRLILVMPESTPIARRNLIKAYGAEIVLTPAEKGMRGAIEKAHELHASTPDSWMPMQFENISNTRAHIEFTAQEIIADFPEGFDYLICGVGTGGHISACGIELKKKFPDMKVLAVEPEGSPVLSGGNPGPHSIQGIGAGFIPGILIRKVMDGIIKVSNSSSYEYTVRLAREEGVLAGISTGAVLAAVGQKLVDFNESDRVLVFCYDSGERYLSVKGLFDVESI